MEQFIIIQSIPCTNSYDIARIPQKFSIQVHSPFASDLLTVTFCNEEEFPIIATTISPNNETLREMMLHMDDVMRTTRLESKMLITVVADVSYFLATGTTRASGEVVPGILDFDQFSDLWTCQLEKVIKELSGARQAEQSDKKHK